MISWEIKNKNVDFLENQDKNVDLLENQQQKCWFPVENQHFLIFWATNIFYIESQKINIKNVGFCSVEFSNK